MADDKVEIILDGKDAGLVRAWMAAKSSVESFENSLIKIDPAQKRNTESARQFEKAASAIFANTRTPLEKYEASLAELNELYIQNKVNSETYNRAVKQLTETLQKEDGTTAKLMATEKAEADAAKQAVAGKLRDESRLLAEKESSAAKQGQLERQVASRRLAAQKAMFLDGQRLTDATATAQERHNIRVSQYKTLLDNGAISQKTFNRALQQANDELSKIREQDMDDALSGGFLAGALAVGTFTAALRIGVDYQAKLREEATETVLELEKAQRIYAIQAGLKDFDAKTATATMLDIAESNAVPVRDVQSISTQLASSGYTNPEKTGTTDALLKIMASSNLESSQGPEVARSIGQFLTAFNKDKNAENLLDVGVRTRGLFAPTEVQLSDLGQFAQAAPSFASAGVSMEDTFSALAILRDAEGPEKAATHGRNVVSLMTTFASDKEKRETLKKMGLKPSDVDLSGETLPQGLEKLMEGFSRLKDDSARGLARESLFGRENITGASILMSNIDKFKTYGEFQHDEAGFEEGVQMGQSGPNAQLNRIEARKIRERNKYQEGLVKEKLLQEEFHREDEGYGLDAQNMGASGFFYGAGMGAKNYMRDTAIWSGLVKPSDIASPENYLNVAKGNESEFKLSDLKKSLDENTKAVKDAAAAKAVPQPVEVKVNGVAAPSKVKAPKPVAAAALSGGPA